MAFWVPFFTSMVAGMVTALVLGAILLPTRWVKKASTTDDAEDVSVQVLVLGDIGRSPRMQYHTLSVAKHGGRVHLIGYRETQPHSDLLASPLVTIHALSPPPSILRSSLFPFLIAGPLKVLWQMLTLSRTLLYRTPPTQWLLVQTPPSIPTLAIAYLAAPLRGTKLLVDWHNYGWSVLATSRGGSSASNHPFVRASRRYESLMARIAPDASLAVTEAMAKQLRAPPYNAKTAVLTLHDRPAALFKPIGSAVERRRTLERIEQTSTLAGPICDGSTRLLVSSTSWTPDEDFGLLLDAVVRYTSVSPDPTPLLLVITGKGPQKAEYEARIAALRAEGKLPGIRIVTAWLTLEDYAALLAVADLGLCLHRSTSGVDLPMKVVDMFGAGLPVAAYAGYESFGELVREGENGFAFETADDLAELLARLFGGAGGSKRGLSAAAELENARKGALKEGSRRWDDEWDEVVAPLLGFSRKEGPNRTD